MSMPYTFHIKYIFKSLWIHRFKRYKYGTEDKIFGQVGLVQKHAIML